MSLKNFIKQVEDSKQLSEMAPSTTSTATAPSPSQKVMVKPGQSQQSAPPATITNQAGKTIAQGDAAQLKKLGDLVNTGQVTMMDPQTGKPLEEEAIEEVAPPGMEDTVLALKKKFPGQEGKAYAIAWSQYNKKHSQDKKVDESMQKEKQVIAESTLEYILGNHPHEHKMCQEGWGMSEDLYEALCDYYFKEGRIPRKLALEGGPALRAHIEECYAKDTGMLLGEDEMEEGLGGAVVGGVAGAALGGPVGAVRGAMAGNTIQNALSEEEFEEGIHSHTARELNPDLFPEKEPSMFKKAADATMRAGKSVLDFIAPDDEKLLAQLAKDEEDRVYEESDLERMLKQTTEMEETMYESKFSKLKSKLTKQPGVTNPDALAAKIGRDKLGQKEMTRRSVAARKDESLEEASTIHKGTYGTSYDAGDDVKKPETSRGRGRPKKDSDDSGEVKSYDTKSLGDIFGGGKKPSKEVGKLTHKNRIKTKADSDDEVSEAVETTPTGVKHTAAGKWGKDRPKKKKDEKLNKSKTSRLDKSMGISHKEQVDESISMWDAQLKSLLEGKKLKEGLSVSTSVGQQNMPDSVTITANDEDAHQLLQLLQNAGVGSGVPGHAISVQSATAPATVLPKTAQQTVGSIAITDGEPNANAQKDINGAGDSVPIMAMPRGMAFSINDETDIPTEPEEVDTVDQEEVVTTLGTEQSKADDGADAALAAIKKLLGQHGTSEVKTPVASADEEEIVDEEWSDEKADEDYDKDGEVESEKEEHEGAVGKAIEKSKGDEDKDEVKEGKETCNECGAMYEGEDHQCEHVEEDQLNEWANSAKSGDKKEEEQFDADIDFMTNVITAGLNGKKRDQTVMPHTKVKVSDGNGSDDTSQLKKLAGIR
jgi:hypothetical protein